MVGISLSAKAEKHLGFDKSNCPEVFCKKVLLEILQALQLY